jgi:1-acyl-sn-glycerol-3-phosphate acyltransferase
MDPKSKFKLTIKAVYLLVQGIPWLKVDYFGEDDGYKKAQIYVCNHIGLFDSFVICAFWAKKWKFTRIIHGMVDSHYLNTPFFGTIIKSLQPIPVHFKSRESNSKVNENSKEELNRLTEEYLYKDESLLIFPEGRLNNTPEILNEIKYGAFNFSKNTNTPIKIMALYGLEKFWPKGKYPVYNAHICAIQYPGCHMFKNKDDYQTTLQQKLDYSYIRRTFLKQNSL